MLGKNYGLISKIVKSFKEITLKTIRKKFQNYDFAWQRSFYDHIIRNDKALNNIRNYIKLNPENGENDKNKFPFESDFDFLPSDHQTPLHSLQITMP